ncbi:glycosyltransferase WbsX family protein [Methyloradius palustris]|uniref:Glycosyl transferase n=1 Tax=Methyloradius palustris TaxID=2778876 RepID=A0A8D5FZR5_9PROT|nr:glycoside hydrolase family 99-like domain-containing protein [Methyloradius palustris]BCM25279.1 glycosyl transferase [Methyloradius palustris]
MGISRKQNIEAPDNSIKLIAMYFPQLHAIPENDEWWGKGFTDWDNVKSGVPQYDGHHQPRIPLKNNYYDQSELETLRWQINLAQQYGVHGFCHYHYWFDGKQLLETPTNLMLENKELDFPFCLSWANETWSKRWDGRDHHILIQQTHPATKHSWKKHYDYLIKAWKDPRAIKVDGKPVFVIYRPQRIEKIDGMLAYWRELAVKDGLPGLYFIFQKQYELPNSDCLNSFDAIFQFQPFEAVGSPSYNTRSIRHSQLFKLVRSLPEKYQDLLRGLRAKFIKELTFHNYEEAWQHIVEIRPDNKLTTYPGAFVDWDNTARYKKRATIFRGATPERFYFWMKKLVGTMSERKLPQNFIFLNAWNEWSEGTYLEPDEKTSHQYLEALEKALSTNSNN